MNTIWHIFWTWAIFRKKKYAIKPILFAFIPDIPWLFGLIFSIIINGISHESFEQGFYYIPIIYATFFFHSFLIVTLFFIIAKIKQKKKYFPYFYGWYFHIFLDYGTHVSDAYPIFWPISDFFIPSVISYWERSHYSFEFAIFNLILASVFVTFLLYNKKEKFARMDIAFLTGLVIMIAVNFIFFFLIRPNTSYLIINAIPLILSLVLLVKIIKSRKK